MHLANGETFKAEPSDLSKFGLVRVAALKRSVNEFFSHVAHERFEFKGTEGLDALQSVVQQLITTLVAGPANADDDATGILADDLARIGTLLQSAQVAGQEHTTHH